MKKIIYALFLFSGLICAQIPSGYYDATNGLTGYALKSKLHEIISTKTINWHYADLSSTYYAITDLDKYYENNNTILDIYTEKPNGSEIEYTPTQLIGTANAEGLGFNREHMMPQSTFNGEYPMYSDLFYVIPADAYINQRRSNYPYAKVGSVISYTATNGSKLGKSITPGYTDTVYEPIDEFKGDVARSLLYFAVRFEGKLNTFGWSVAQNPLDGTEEKAFEDWYIALLKEWNALDPVSQREKDRNNAVYNIQKNRNPFIDHPEFVNLIWSETGDAALPDSPLNLISVSKGENFVTLSWSPSTAGDVLGYKIYVNNILTATSKTSTVSIDRLLPSTAYTFTVKSYDKLYLESDSSNPLTETTLSTDNFAKDLMISKYLEGTSNNKAIEIINKTGHDVNLDNYKLVIQLRNANFYYSDPFQLEGVIKNGETKVIMNPNAAFTCFNVSNADFATASPSLTFSGSQYIELNYKDIPVDVVGVKDVSNAFSNQSLYRSSAVSDPTTTFNINEWQVHASNYCQNLGNTLQVNQEDETKDWLVYPNPVTDTRLFVKGKFLEKINTAEIFEISGRKIYQKQKPFLTQDYLDVAHLKSGIYFLRLDEKIFKVIIK